MRLTIKELRNAIKGLDDNAIVYFEHIQDKYVDGYMTSSNFNGKVIQDFSEGWQTEDMPCDEGCDRIKTDDEWNEKLMDFFCTKCPHRHRYIESSRCFSKEGNLYIDGHF